MSESFKIFPSKSKSIKYAEQTCKKIIKNYPQFLFDFIINQSNNKVTDIDVFVKNSLEYKEFRKFEFNFQIDSNYFQDPVSLVILDWEINVTPETDNSNIESNSNVSNHEIEYNDNLDWDQQSQDFWEQF